MIEAVVKPKPLIEIALRFRRISRDLPLMPTKPSEEGLFLRSDVARSRQPNRQRERHPAHSGCRSHRL